MGKEVGDALEHRPGLKYKGREGDLVTTEGQVSGRFECVHGRAWSGLLACCRSARDGRTLERSIPGRTGRATKHRLVRHE